VRSKTDYNSPLSPTHIQYPAVEQNETLNCRIVRGRRGISPVGEEKVYGGKDLWFTRLRSPNNVRGLRLLKFRCMRLICCLSVYLLEMVRQHCPVGLLGQMYKRLWTVNYICTVWGAFCMFFCLFFVLFYIIFRVPWYDLH